LRRLARKLASMAEQDQEHLDHREITMFTAFKRIFPAGLLSRYSKMSRAPEDGFSSV